MSDKSRNNADINVTGKQTGRNTATGNYTYDFNLKQIPEGSYNVQLNARDSFSNTGSLAYKTVTVDNSPPSISINYENKPITSNVTVFGGKRPNSARRYSDQTLVNSHDASRWTGI